MADNSKTVVLVADDEPSTLAMLASHLRAKGYTVLEASDGDQAWELAHEHLPHLVVLDVMMPGMSGWEVCRKIREAVSLAHTGVLMLTGIGENLNEMTSPLYGADAHVDKPFEFAELDRKLKEILDKRRAGALGRPDDTEESRVALGWDELSPTKNGKAPEPLESTPRPVAKAKPQKPPPKPAPPKKAVERPLKPAPAIAKKAPSPAKKAAPPSKKPAKAAAKVAKKAPAKPLPVKKAPAKAVKAPAKKTPAKAPAKKTPPAKAPARTVKAPAKKAPAKAVKAPAKKASPKPVKAPAKKAPAKAVKAPAKKASPKPVKAPAKKTAAKAPAPAAAAKNASKPAAPASKVRQTAALRKA